MPNTGNNTKFGTLRKQVERLIHSSNGSVPSALIQAVQSLQTAIDYEDRTMMRAHVQTARNVLIDHITGEVEKLLEWSAQAWKEIQAVLSTIEGEPFEPGEQFDELGQSVSYLICSNLSVLTNYRTDQDVLSQFPNPKRSSA